MKQPKPLIAALKEAIEKSGLSQNSIAVACEINQANLNAFMHDRRSISIETAEKIASHLELELRKASKAH
jgi:plasmid maintenance system antidote protein VapI